MNSSKQLLEITSGWLTGAEPCPSDNCGLRPEGADISLLVIHNISLPPGQYGGGWVQRFFTNRLDPGEHPYFAQVASLNVSSHLLIERHGRLTQFVSFDERAWHAGQSCFQGRAQCNDFSIGIELEGTDTDPYTDRQYEVLARVTGALMAHYPAIGKDRIVGHCDIAPVRKTDPGPAFDWQRYRNML